MECHVSARGATATTTLLHSNRCRPDNITRWYVYILYIVCFSSQSVSRVVRGVWLACRTMDKFYGMWLWRWMRWRKMYGTTTSSGTSSPLLYSAILNIRYIGMLHTISHYTDQERGISQYRVVYFISQLHLVNNLVVCTELNCVYIWAFVCACLQKCCANIRPEIWWIINVVSGLPCTCACIKCVCCVRYMYRYVP